MNRVFIPKRLIVLYRSRFNTWFRSLIFFLVSTTARSRLRRSGEEEEEVEEGKVEVEEEEGVAIEDLEEDKVEVEEGVVVEVGFSLEEVLEEEEEVLLVALLANLRLALNSAILACSNWMSLGSSWLRRVSS